MAGDKEVDAPVGADARRDVENDLLVHGCEVNGAAGHNEAAGGAEFGAQDVRVTAKVGAAKHQGSLRPEGSARAVGRGPGQALTPSVGIVESGISWMAGGA